MGTDIARRGSNFTIRKFTFYPLTPAHMMHYGTVDSLQLAYLWLAIENGKSILISGGTATGKTSLLNALSLFIRPNMKILSIEDTPELRLPHIHWVPEVARSPISVKGEMGKVTLFDLLKSSLRQRPDYLVVGEVRGREAFVLFQQIATGHPSIATIHAASLTQLIDRLVTPPISLPPALIENVDIIIFLQRIRIRGKDVRRSSQIVEIVGLENERPQSAKVFEWVPGRDDYVSKQKSKVLDDIARMTGNTEESIQIELLRRKAVLEWMHSSGTYDYNEVGRVVSEYYGNPDSILSLIDESDRD
jgi:flagellar protein FlaI